MISLNVRLAQTENNIYAQTMHRYPEFNNSMLSHSPSRNLATAVSLGSSVCIATYILVFLSHSWHCWSAHQYRFNAFLSWHHCSVSRDASLLYFNQKIFPGHERMRRAPAGAMCKKTSGS